MFGDNGNNDDEINERTKQLNQELEHQEYINESEVVIDEEDAHMVYKKWIQDDKFKNIEFINTFEEGMYLICKGRRIDIKYGVGALFLDSNIFLLNDITDGTKGKSMLIHIGKKGKVRMMVRYNNLIMEVKPEDVAFIYFVTKADKVFYIFKALKGTGPYDGYFTHIDQDYFDDIDQMALNTSYILNPILFQVLNREMDILN